MQGRSALTRISTHLRRKVPIGVAVLHEFARDSAHKADDDF